MADTKMAPMTLSTSACDVLRQFHKCSARVKGAAKRLSGSWFERAPSYERAIALLWHEACPDGVTLHFPAERTRKVPQHLTLRALHAQAILSYVHVG